MTRVLGVDPGLAACGWALVERVGTGVELRGHGVLTTTPDDGSDLARVELLSARLAALLGAQRPDVVASEAWVRRYAGKGAASPHAHTLGLVIGAVRAVCLAAGVEHREGARAQGWRTALGLPRTASKAAAQDRVRAVLRHPQVIRPQHANDAAAVAIVAAAGGGRVE